MLPVEELKFEYAAKHSGARNFWLSTRREGDVFVLEMRDDGRVWLLPAENSEATAHLRDASDEARLTPKEKEVFALVLKRRTTPRSPRSCTSASTR